ncbi:hypothetical protein IQ06DRAFT_368577 [Phaeosphaeriaceae sp. SRC1lsM3a]|nr:hypothetical protein IQ06DRAFT_368577 [Stagonospora sp. SRC1lsM3a]
MPAFTSCTNAANTLRCRSDPPPGLNHINEVADSCNNQSKSPRTPLPSPTRLSSPTDPQPDPQPDPRSTPLRRRFLEETGLSPVTPPRTPSPTKERASPSKKIKSPSKGIHSPTKQNLEIRQGGFYFSCELPPSKITPKKKDQGVGTSTSRTPSPMKMGGATQAAMSRDTSPSKQTPSKRVSPEEKQTPSKTAGKAASTKQDAPLKFGAGNLAATKLSATKNGIPRKSATPNPYSSTPLREAATPQSENGKHGGRTSPTKSIKLGTKLAQDAITPKSVRFAAQKSSVKQEPASNETVVTVSSSSTNSSGSLLSTIGQAQTRSARVGSFDIGESMAALKNYIPQLHHSADRHAERHDGSDPPTPLRRAAEKLEHTAFIRMSDIRPDTLVTETEDHARSVLLADAISEPHVYASPSMLKEQISHDQPLPVPLQAPPSSEMKPTPPPSKKQVMFTGSEPTLSRLPRPVVPKTLRRAGTDPLVHLAMRQEMSTLTKSLRGSLGIDFRQKRREAAATPPPEQISLPESEEGSPSLQRRNVLLSTTSGVTSVSNASGSSVGVPGTSASMTQKQPAAPGAPNAAKGVAKLSPKGTKLHARKDPPATTTDQEGHSHLRKVISHASGSTHPQSAASTRTITPQKKPSTPARYGTPSAARASHVTPNPKLTATPAKPKATSTIPQSARKSVFDSPARNIASPARPKAQKPLSIDTAKDELPTQLPHPVFVGAQDIAARVAEWNKSPSARSTPLSPKSNTKLEQSSTPEGSPPKPITPIATTITALPPKTPKATSFTPRRAAPATPVQNRTPAPNRPVARVRDSALGVKGKGKGPDPMATRTPSKGIQESLGEAIDRKIEEDRRNVGSWRG